MTQEECNLFTVLLPGEQALQGFRNADLREALYPADERHPPRRPQASGEVTHWLRLLRARGLIGKVSHTRYYRFTPTGYRLTTATLTIRSTNLFRIAS